MLVIKNKQLEAFRPAARKASKDKLVACLREQTGATITESGTSIHIQDGRGRVSSLQFSEQNLLSAYQKPSGCKFQFEYDSEDRFHALRIPGNEVLGIEYSKDRPSAIISAGVRFVLKYDEGGRLSRIIYPDATFMEFLYTSPTLSGIKNRAGEQQLFSSTKINKQTIHKLTDPTGKETTLIVDEQEALQKIVLPDGSNYTIRFDEELGAEIIKLRNGTEKTTYFESYDSMRSEWEDGSYLAIEYNSDSAITRLENETGILQFGYDDAKQLVSGSFNKSIVTYDYDNGLLQRTNYPSGLTVSCEYDVDDRLSQIVIGDASCRFAYDINGTVSELDYSNGCRELQRNTVLLGQRETILQSKNRILLSRLSYGYDQLGRVGSYTHERAGQQLLKQTLAYDDGDRLTRVSDVSGVLKECFQYGASGVMIVADGKKMDTGKLDEVRSIGGQTVSYDKGGNVSGFINERGQQIGLQYRDNGTLRTAVTRSGLWKYEYDGLGRRIRKSNGTNDTTFFWSGDRLLSEKFYSDTKVICRDYIYTDSNVPIAFSEGNKVYWLQRDVRDAVVAVHDGNGDIVWEATYDSFGCATITEEHIHQPWRLAGQYYDEETGLHYSQARYYSPHLKSFLSLDLHCLEYGVGNYSYAGNDPYNRIDSDGLMPKWLSTTLAIGAGIAATAAVAAAAAAIAPAAGVSLLSLMVVGAISGAVGGAVEPIVKNLLDSKPICWKCVARGAAIGAVAGAAMIPVFKYLGKAMGSAGARLAPRIVRYAPKLAGIAKTALGKMRLGLALVRAVTRRGNFGLGSATREEAMKLGKRWVGKGYRIASDGKSLVSMDGTKVFRPPTFKPRLNKTQANFEWRTRNRGPMEGNAHLDIAN